MGDRFLDLDCVPEFKIEEASVATKDIEQAKDILDEIVRNKDFKGEVKKKLMRAIKLLEGS